MDVLAKTTARLRQGELGQFFTPPHVAELMASMFASLPAHVRLLDAGAGAGALTSAIVARCCRGIDGVRSITASLYEIDSHILNSLLDEMNECQRLCEGHGIDFRFHVHHADFIGEMAEQISNSMFATEPAKFNVIIANPPYRKIGTESAERQSLRSAGIETSNLYTGFISIMQKLLELEGQLVAITPRSFCNGPYFRSFRQSLLSDLEVHRLHTFEARDIAFQGDSVLQENIIFLATKGTQQPANITISMSTGSRDSPIREIRIPFSEVVQPSDKEQFIHIPTARSHGSAKQSMGALRNSLGSLGLKVSTGPVVDFRLKNFLRGQPGADTVPLLYPAHFNGGTVHWPKPESRKPNAIVDNDETHRWLVPSGIYILTKRFTSKEERRRLVACMFDPSVVHTEWLGLENHLNYFHANGEGLERDIAIGLYVYLNSTMVDQYFRRFSGHTQVNATDLRSLPYPDIATLRAIGMKMQILSNDQTEIDALLQEHLNVLE